MKNHRNHLTMVSRSLGLLSQARRRSVVRFERNIAERRKNGWETHYRPLRPKSEDASLEQEMLTDPFDSNPNSK